MNPGGPEAIEHYKQYLASLEDLKHPRVLEELSRDEVDYDAIFLPGGHGPMSDLDCSVALGEIVQRVKVRDKLVVAVCHGPAGLLPAVEPDGTWAFKGYRLTAFTKGRRYELPNAFLLRPDDRGQITEIAAYWDDRSFYSQLGKTTLE